MVELTELVCSVGLEIHVRLACSTKLFCGCRLDSRSEDNANICPVCLGLPGSLPVLSPEAVALGLRLALALGSAVQAESRFERKHYFYPDLPRNYQITQVGRPLALGGSFTAGGATFPVERLHLEEDAARLGDGPRPGLVSVDFNRAGAPLMEVVTLPVEARGAEVRQWLRDFQRLVRWIGAGDAKLEDGSLRCDANVGFLARGDADAATAALAGPWTELKNLNSPGAVQRAVDYEKTRLTGQVVAGETLSRQTRRWDETEGVTRFLRAKDETRDYRFLVDPDLPPVRIKETALATAREICRELPADRRSRYAAEFGLEGEVLGTLCRDRHLGDYFEAVVRLCGSASAATVAGWVVTEVAGRWASDALEPAACPVAASHLAELLDLMADGQLTSSTAKEVLALVLETPAAPPRELAEAAGLLGSLDGRELENLCRQALAEGAEAVAAWRGGKAGALDHLVGQVMRLAQGRADPVIVRNRLLETLAG